MHEFDPKISLDEALELYETQTALADALGVLRQTVSQWHKLEYIPAIHAYRLRELHPEKFQKAG